MSNPAALQPPGVTPGGRFIRVTTPKGDTDVSGTSYQITEDSETGHGRLDVYDGQERVASYVHGAWQGVQVVHQLNLRYSIDAEAVAEAQAYLGMPGAEASSGQ